MREHPLGLLADRALRDPGTLSRRDKAGLRQLYKEEVRKGAFVPRAGSTQEEVQEAFLQHVRQHFAQRDQVLEVIDFQPLLHRRARAASRGKMPLTALLLYATWLEHWLNMMLSVAMLRSGTDVVTVDRFFEGQPTLERKLELLGPALGLTQLNKQARDRMIQVMRTRHRYVHYTWNGKKANWYSKDLAGMKSLIPLCDNLIADLKAYEHMNLDAPHAHIASAIFAPVG